MSSSNRGIEKARYWQGLIKEQRASGMSVSAFCKLKNIKDSRFWYWSSVLRRQKRMPKGTADVPPVKSLPMFVPVDTSVKHKQTVADDKGKARHGRVVVQIIGSVDEYTLASIFRCLEIA